MNVGSNSNWFKLQKNGQKWKSDLLYLPSILAPFPTYGIPVYCRQYLLGQRSLECAYELLNMSIFDNFKARVIWQILGFDLDTRGKLLFHYQNFSFGMKILKTTDNLMHLVFFHFFLDDRILFSDFVQCEISVRSASTIW